MSSVPKNLLGVTEDWGIFFALYGIEPRTLQRRRLGIARQEEIPLAELEVEFCSLHTEAKFQLCQH